MTLSRDFLLSRGSCCGMKCKNCPYTKPVFKGNTNVESVIDDVCRQFGKDRLERGIEEGKPKMEKAD